jgi:Fic family protein
MQHKITSVAWTIEELQEHLLIGSTLVEGSTLTDDQARAVLAGRTVQGHPIREVRELSNYRGATQWLMERLDEAPFVSLDLLLGYHARLMQGIADDAGSFKAYENFTMRTDGTRFDYRHPSLVLPDMTAWLTAFNRAAQDDPVAFGAELYARFEAVHPFSDGNGRIGRVLLAWYLYRETGETFRFYASDKLEHLRAIEASDRGDLVPLANFVRARLKA